MIPQLSFEEFNKLVKKYYFLNKEKTRYLIIFNNNEWEFYDKIDNFLIKRII
jgi:hypothetical protein